MVPASMRTDGKRHLPLTPLLDPFALETEDAAVVSQRSLDVS